MKRKEKPRFQRHRDYLFRAPDKNDDTPPVSITQKPEEQSSVIDIEDLFYRKLFYIVMAIIGVLLIAWLFKDATLLAIGISLLVLYGWNVFAQYKSCGQKIRNYNLDHYKGMFQILIWAAFMLALVLGGACYSFYYDKRAPTAEPSIDEVKYQLVSYLQLHDVPVAGISVDFYPLDNQWMNRHLYRKDGWKKVEVLRKNDCVYFYSSDSLTVKFIPVGREDSVIVGIRANTYYMKKLNQWSLIYLKTDLKKTAVWMRSWLATQADVGPYVAPLFHSGLCFIGMICCIVIGFNGLRNIKLLEKQVSNNEYRIQFAAEEEWSKGYRAGRGSAIEEQNHALAVREEQRQLAVQDMKYREQMTQSMLSTTLAELGIMEAFDKGQNLYQKMVQKPSDSSSRSIAGETQKWSDERQMASMTREQRINAQFDVENDRERLIKQCQQKYGIGSEKCKKCIEDVNRMCDNDLEKLGM